MISIIVPIYQVEKYIRQCVDSIIAQTYKDIEIILVDDGSPDNCPQICDEYAEKDDRVKVIHQENKGLIEARKSGLRASTGEYVCFVDSDDWIEPDMYEQIIIAIQQHEPDCVITQFFYSYSEREEQSKYCFSKEYYNKTELVNEVFPVMLFKDKFYTFGVYPNCWTKVFKKSILEKHLYDVDSRIRMGEDIAFTFPCLMECNSLAFVDRALYHYRINPESMTKSYDINLKDIYLLPYLSLVEKSVSLKVDLSGQLPYYLLYLTNFVIRNEASVYNSETKSKTKGVLAEVVNNDYLERELTSIDLSKLPFHTKLLTLALKSKSIVLLEIYMRFIRRTF